MAQLHQLTRWEAFRLLPRLLKNPAAVMEENLRRHDGIYGSWLGNHQIVITDDPACAQYALQSHHQLFRKPAETYGVLARALGDGLLSSGGERWQRHRKAIQPGFHPSRIASLGTVMVAEANRLADQWGTGGEKTVNWGDAMVSVTGRIMARTLFGDGLTESDYAEVRRAHDASEQMVIKEIRAPLLLPWLRLTGEVDRVEAGRASARNILFRAIAQRRALPAGQPPDDLLQMLLDARFEGTDEGLTDEDVAAEAMTFYMAGHETSARALTWFLYEIGQNSELQAELRAEAETVCGHRDATAGDVGSLPLLRSCLEETLRLHPPAWIVDREPTQDVELAGHPIPAGRIVAFCLYSMHRRPDLWSDATTFQPRRFLSKDAPRDAYLPFGAGPRKCIGQHFAMMEMMLVLAQWLRRFELRSQNAEQVQPRALITLGLDRPLQVSCRERR